MKRKVKCIDCTFIRIDEKAGTKKKAAYACGNKASEFYNALLNTTPDGDVQKVICWPGCEHGRKKVKS